MDIELKTLADTPLERVLDAFQGAFGDYAVGFDRREVESMLERRGFNAELSAAAFDGDRMVSFVLNGIGPYEGVLSGYDCGTGTLPGYRGEGLAGKLFEYSLPLLRDAGVSQYLLEVLTSNAPAIAVYRRNGFETVAEYDCFRQEVGLLRLGSGLAADVEIRELTYDAFASLPDFGDFAPSWQNSAESLRRGAAGLLFFGAYLRHEPVGCCVLDPITGDLARIAVRRDYRRQGIATALLASATARAESASVKVLNVDRECDSPHRFLEAVGFGEGLSQYGMRRML
ncbi:MAG: GNAT family N-acetyltransferase [[Clostridium] fimetarium]|nr:GNAT family N-acetyltransferase [Alistipes timonensis]MCM1404793.1 GNAT family N-acetyltransferase [[Clostridium] fimetarium]